VKTRFFAVLIIMALAAALPSTAAAQLNQTGTLAGTVTDSDKLPLPGATVTIKSPVIIVPQMDAITGPKGNYRFLSLPPGLYEVAFSLDGMDTLVRKDIRISVAQTTTIDAVLEPSTLSETVVVVGESPTIDVKSTTKATNLDRTFIAALPTARNLDAYFNMAPGVTAERNPNGLMSSASGSGVRDNSYNLDGVNMTAPDVGTQQFQFGTDIIDEILIQSGGMPAEFGDAMGASINIVTRSGGNRLSGSASVYYNTLKLQSNNTAGTPLEGAKSGYQYVLEPGIALGGPIAKERLWFFTNLSLNSRSRLIPGFPYDQPAQVPAKETRYYPYVKLTFQPSQAHRFSASYNYSDYLQDNAGANRFATESTTVKWTAPTHILNLQWTATFSPTMFADFKVGYYVNNQELRSKEDLPLIVEQTTAQQSGSYVGTDLYTAGRFQTNANLTYFADSLAGSHEFKGGVEFQAIDSTQSFTPNVDPRNGMSQIITRRGTPRYGVVMAPSANKVAGTNIHAYLQDSWKPAKRLTLNPGLRLTYQSGRFPPQNESEGPQDFLGVSFNRSVTRTINAFNRTALAPRLGVIFDLTGDRKTLLKASYSRYLQSNIIAYYASANPNGSFSYVQALAPDWTPVPGAYLNASFPIPAKAGYDGAGIKTPYTDEFAVAVERELFPDWVLSARYTRKADRKLIEDVDANQLDIDRLAADGALVWTNWTQVPFTDPYDGQERFFWSMNAILPPDSYLMNPPGAERDFKGVELTLNKRYSRGWSLMASYVWQDAVGLISTSWGGSTANSGLFDNPNSHINQYGHASLSPRSQVKVLGMVAGPWGINVSGFFRYFTGQRYTRTLHSSDMGVTLAQGNETINAEKRGSRELPSQVILDLRLEKLFRLGGTKVAFFADCFNLFNGNKATSVHTRSGSPVYVFGQMTAIQDPRAVRLGFRFEF